MDKMKEVLYIVKYSFSLSQLAFLTRSTILGVLSSLVKESRQLKQQATFQSCNCKVTIIHTTTMIKSRGAYTLFIE
jgi:hypothetical protein